MTKCQKDPTCAIFLKRGLFKDIKNDISMCQTCKYKIQIQNTQIQHITKCQKHPTYGIFLKQLYNSSNMINAESAQFTRSSCLRISKITFLCAKRIITKIQIQNTQIHKYSILRSTRKTHHVAYI